MPLRYPLIGLIVVLLAGGAFALANRSESEKLLVLPPAASPSPSAVAERVMAQSEPPPSPAEATAKACGVNAILVNSCRPWLGARANDYPEAANNLRAQIEYHEQRIGRKIDIAHSYSTVGSVPLSSEHDRYLATRSGTYLFANWKPAAQWKAAGGGDAQVNALIDRAVANLKSIAPKKIFLTLHHEPENDVTSSIACRTKPGKAGTAAEYRQMWAHVRARFEAAGVHNVVWVMDYMNYPEWDCLVPELYPGDRYVDWIMFNAYGTGRTPDFVTNVARFQKLLTAMNGPDRQVLTKPWGIVEWGVHDATPAQARSYYEQAAAALDKGRFPNLRAYMIFDSPGVHDQGGLRIRYDDDGRLDLAEQDAYRAFANHPKLDK